MRGVVMVGLLALAIAAAGVAAANERPMAEAGLDQDSTVNSTVYLDAGGSIDPDGDIVSYDWAIERPNGTTTVPDCETCSLTHFVPMRPGQYNVTVTVTDEDGASMNDTMYVTVEGLFIPPSAPSPGGGSGGSWGGGGSGGNSDSVMYNYQSGNLWIELARGDENVNLGGANRDPEEYGADYNAWMTDDEISKLVDLGYAEKFDNRIKISGPVAGELRSSLDNSSSTEYENPAGRSYTTADQTVNELNEDNVVRDSANEENELVDDQSSESQPTSTSYAPLGQMSGENNSNPDDSGESDNSDSDDSNNSTYRPEGCTMAAFCTSS